MDLFVDESEQSQRLLAAAGAGNRQAFDELFAKHESFLRRMIEVRMDARLRTRVDPADVVQETHIEARRRFDDYFARRPMPLALWLRKTAQERLSNLTRDHLRTARRSAQREVALPDNSTCTLARLLIAPDSTPSQAASKRELADIVRGALADLDEIDREILLMRYIEDLSNQQVAAMLEIDPVAASKRHGRALKRFEAVLREKGLVEP